MTSWCFSRLQSMTSNEKGDVLVSRWRKRTKFVHRANCTCRCGCWWTVKPWPCICLAIALTWVMASDGNRRLDFEDGSVPA